MLCTLKPVVSLSWLQNKVQTSSYWTQKFLQSHPSLVLSSHPIPQPCLPRSPQLPAPTNALQTFNESEQNLSLLYHTSPNFHTCYFSCSLHENQNHLLRTRSSILPSTSPPHPSEAMSLLILLCLPVPLQHCGLFCNCPVVCLFPLVCETQPWYLSHLCILFKHLTFHWLPHP